MRNGIAIIDLGGQYCHLIGRRLRDFGVTAKIYGPEVRPNELAAYAGIILSGGPNSVYEADAPKIQPSILELKRPILGICYGHQLLAQMLGAKVERGSSEYGPTRLFVTAEDGLFRDLPGEQLVWMSHADTVTELPGQLSALASTEQCRNAAFADSDKRFYGVQFHPEVIQTEYGRDILRRFVAAVCGLEIRKDVKNRVEQLLQNIRARVGNKSVFFLVSGGVDSTVAFVLCSKALPKERILGLYVDTGLMRKGEKEELIRNLESVGLCDRLRIKDESELFLSKLEGVVDPEEKRRIIGGLFVAVQSNAMTEYGIDGGEWLLGQGTIYPDTIESGGATGRAAVIKTHHNRSPEILDLLERGRVIEPLAEFYKDEVRELGMLLGLDSKLTNRWPFPGPGLAIRCLCTRTPDNARRLDNRFEVLIENSGLEGAVIPIKSVGVQGDVRTYKHVVALLHRQSHLDYETLQSLSTKLCNIHTTTNRVIVLIAGAVRGLKEAFVKPAALTENRLEMLREADFIVRRRMEKAGLSEKVWQFPVVLAPISFRGGDVVILRPVNSEDGMTASFARLPSEALRGMAEEILAAGKGNFDAVFLDVTSKPPATIEWE